MSNMTDALGPSIQSAQAIFDSLDSHYIDSFSLLDIFIAFLFFLFILRSAFSLLDYEIYEEDEDD